MLLFSFQKEMFPVLDMLILASSLRLQLQYMDRIILNLSSSGYYFYRYRESKLRAARSRREVKRDSTSWLNSFKERAGTGRIVNSFVG